MSARHEPIDKLLTGESGLGRIAGDIEHLPKAFPRRVNADPEQVESMGETFMKLDQRMQELKEHFELEDRDLNINLGPLGNLL